MDKPVENGRVFHVFRFFALFLINIRVFHVENKENLRPPRHTRMG